MMIATWEFANLDSDWLLVIIYLDLLLVIIRNLY